MATPIRVLNAQRVVIGVDPAQYNEEVNSLENRISDISTNVRLYGASGSVLETTGSISAGSNQLTVTNRQDFNVGNGIAVVNAGGTGVDLVTTITAINDTTFTLADSAVVGVASVKVRHDDTKSFTDAITAVKSPSTTETVPAEGAESCVDVPAGRFNISSSVYVPAYIKIRGRERNTTIIESYITNGDPVFYMTDPDGAPFQFYCSIESLTIFGRDQDCQGIKVFRTSRWVLRDVMIDRCNHEGLWLERAYIGEVYSPMIRACGDSTHAAVRFGGATAADGSHAVTFIGGEFNGGVGTGVGLKMDHGISVSLFGTTIEGFTNGAGIVNHQAHSLTVDGCYFEANKENIVETGITLASSYINSYFAEPVSGSRGHIGITYAQACKIEGNFFVASSTTVKIFDATADSTGKLESSSVKANYAPSWPMMISQSLLDSARKSGTVIDTFDATTQGNSLVYGNRKYKDEVTFGSDIILEKGIRGISGKNINIKGGTGSPEGVVTASPGSMYLRTDGGAGATFYVKETGVNTNTGWIAK